MSNVPYKPKNIFSNTQDLLLDKSAMPPIYFAIFALSIETSFLKYTRATDI